MIFEINPRVEVVFGATGEPQTWTWTDITDDLLGGTPIQVNRGRQNEQSHVQPSELSLVLRDPRGDYTPGNPLGVHYPFVELGVPIRVRMPELAGDGVLLLPGVAGSYVATPDSATVDVTGDLDVRIELDPQTWFPVAAPMQVVGKWRFADGAEQRSWMLQVLADGRLELGWTEDGTNATRTHVPSGAPLTSEGRRAVRATLDVDDGAGNHIVSFYTADSVAGPWTPLGAPVVIAGTTALFNSDAELTIGTADGGTVFVPGRALGGEVYVLEVRAGIDGTLVADPDFQTLDADASSFEDGVGNVWTLHGHAAGFDPSVRYYGFVAEWLPEWPYGDLSDDEDPERDPGEATVSVKASGVLRRLGQGAKPLDSAMRRGMTDFSIEAPVAYWSCEDGADSAALASAIPGAPALTLGLTPAGQANPDTEMAAYSGFVASNPVPQWKITSGIGPVPWVDATGELRMFALVRVPEAGVSAEVQLLNLRTTGTAAEWSLELNPADSDGDLRLRAWDRTGSQILDSGFFDTNINDKKLLAGIWLVQDGANIDWQFFYTEEGTDTIFAPSGTLNGETFGSAESVVVGAQGNLNGTAIGHIAVFNRNTNAVIWDAARNLLTAWAGETAGARIARLCTEQDVPLQLVGNPADTQPVGPQRPDTFVNLLTAAADADGGILYEPRRRGLAYRTRTNLYNQTPALVLDAKSQPGGDIVNPFAPALDDQAARNEITVARKDGSSVTVSDPHDIAKRGRYDAEVTLNVATDGQLDDIAGWRLHLGTWPGMRYPSVAPAINVNPDLIGDWVRAELGDRIDVINLPPQHPPDDTVLLMQGYTESMLPYRWDVQVNASPGGPWTVGIYDDEVLGRLDTITSTNIAPFTSGVDTQLEVASGIFEGFEEPTPFVPLANAGDVPWQRDDSDSHSGSWSLRSGPITHSQTSEAIVTVPGGLTHVSFWYRVSTEETFDEFVFLIDGLTQFSASGEVPWTQSPTFAVFEGQQLTFRYIKDSTDSLGTDAVWIDDLSFTIGPIWETDPALAQFPFDVTIAGIQLRVTNITGESSPQLFTVEQQPVNGVTKTIGRGARLSLVHPAVIAL